MMVSFQGYANNMRQAVLPLGQGEEKEEEIEVLKEKRKAWVRGMNEVRDEISAIHCQQWN